MRPWACAVAAEQHYCLCLHWQCLLHVTPHVELTAQLGDHCGAYLLVAPVMPSGPQHKFISTIIVMTIASHNIGKRQGMHVRLTIHSIVTLEYTYTD